MSRLRFPGGIVNSHQVRGLADLAQDCAGGYVDVTTRANLQFREIGPRYHPCPFDGPARIRASTNRRSPGAEILRLVTRCPDPRGIVSE